MAHDNSYSFLGKALVIDGISALVDAASGLFGWRSVAGLFGGAILAGAIYLIRSPGDSELRPLIALMALCYFVGIILDFAAARARRRTTL
jgi:hypothetical protein